jgi:hypothetical protein
VTLPASGAINTAQLLAELQSKNPARQYPLSILDSDVLAMIGKSGPPVNFPADFYGKTAGGDAVVVSSADGVGSYDSTYSGGTPSCNPSVSASGGSGGYTYAWVFTSNPNGCALANATSAACNVSNSYAKGANGSASATLQCTVTDSTGHAVVKSGITATLNWTSTYTPMTVTGHDDAASGISTIAGGTVTCFPSVTVTGGSGGATYQWSFVGSAQGCALGNANGSSCNVSHTFAKNSTGSVTPQLQCVVTDNTGHVTSAAAYAYLDWGNNQ